MKMKDVSNCELSLGVSSFIHYDGGVGDDEFPPLLIGLWKVLN
jgi:hypothetical protein